MARRGGNSGNEVKIILSMDLSSLGPNLRSAEQQIHRFVSNVEGHTKRMGAAFRSTIGDVKKLGDEIRKSNDGTAQTSKTASEGLGLVKYAIAAATAAAIGYGKASIDAFSESGNAQRKLLQAATSAKVGLGEQADAVAKLRKEYGLSLTEAAQLQAGAIQAANVVGRPQDADVFAKRIADLRAAKGVATDLTTLMRQLYTSDEATDALLNLNPSQVAKNYIEKNNLKGKVDPQDIQNLSIFNAVLEEGEKVSGAASEALTDLDGSVKLLNAGWEDAQAAVGGFILSNGLVSDVLAGTIDSVNGLNSAVNGLEFKSLNDAVEDDLKTFGARFETYVTDPIQKGLILLGTLPQGIWQGIKAVVGRLGKGDQTLIDESDAFRQALDERLKEVDTDRKTRVEERQGAINQRVQRAEARQGRYVNGRRLNDSEFRTYQGELRRNAELAKEQKRVSDQSQKEAEKQALEGAKRLEAVYRNADDIVGSAASRTLGDDPFIKLFAERASAMERFAAKFGDVNTAVTRRLAGNELQQIDKKLFEARLGSRLTALSFRQEAARFGRPLVGPSGDETRAGTVAQAAVEAALNRFNLGRQISQLNFQTTGIGDGIGVSEQLRQQIESLTGALNPVQGGRFISELADGRQFDSVRRIIDQRVLSLTDNVNFAGARNGRDGALGDVARTRADALQREQARQAEDLQRAIAGTQEDARLVQDAKDRIAAIRSTPASNEFQRALLDKEFLSIGRQLPANEIVGMKLELAGAANREAQREVERERTAERAVTEAREDRQAIRSDIRAMLELQQKQGLLTVNINEKTGALDVAKFAGPRNGGAL